MIKMINIRLYKGNNVEYEKENIKSIIKDGSISFIIDDIKTNLNKEYFIRENNDYKFIIDINKKESLYTLKQQNMSFDIEVQNVFYKEDKKNITLEYKISTEDEFFKLVIERDEDNE